MTYIRQSADQSGFKLIIPITKAWFLSVAGLTLGVVWTLLLSVGVGVTDQELFILLQTVGLFLGAVSLVAMLVIWTDRDVDALDLNIPTKPGLKYTVGGVAAIFGVVVVAGWVFSQLGVDNASHSIFASAELGLIDPMILLILAAFSILFISPAEEIIFRNIVQKSLYSYLTGIGSVIVASLIFAIVHLPAYAVQGATAALASIVVIIPMSVILGYSYLKTDNLTIPIIIHGVYNALIFIMQYRSIVG